MKLTSTLPAILMMLAIWTILNSVCSASANTVPSIIDIDAKLQRRQCVINPGTGAWDCDLLLPNLNQIVARYRNFNDKGRATPENHAWFYTNLDLGLPGVAPETVFGLCTGWFLAQGQTSYWIEDGINQEWRLTQSKYIGDYLNAFIATNTGRYPGGNTPLVVLFCCNFHAAAAAAMNPDAFVFTKHDEEWNPQRIWATVEFPALTRNPNIQRVWRVDPRPASPNCGEKVLVWDRARGDAEVAGWTCPVV